jgi:hypothetical protein
MSSSGESTAWRPMCALTAEVLAQVARFLVSASRTRRTSPVGTANSAVPNGPDALMTRKAPRLMFHSPRPPGLRISSIAVIAGTARTSDACLQGRHVTAAGAITNTPYVNLAGNEGMGLRRWQVTSTLSLPSRTSRRWMPSQSRRTSSIDRLPGDRTVAFAHDADSPLAARVAMAKTVVDTFKVGTDAR